MVKRKIKPISMIICLALLCLAVFGVTAVQAHATDAGSEMFVSVSEGFTYAVTDDTTVTGFTVSEDISGYFEVVIPSGVTRIAANSFVGTDNEALSDLFVRVVIPDSVTTIERDAFVDCKKLLEVRLPAALLNGIADTGLRGVPSKVTADADLSLRTVQTTNGRFLFVRNGSVNSTEWLLAGYDATATELVLPSVALCDTACTAYKVYRNTFANGNFTSVIVPTGVTEIGERAFGNCADLTTVSLPEGLENIGADAFYGTGITTLSVPSSVTSIGGNAFKGCARLTEITFAARTRKLTVYHYAFSDCIGLKTIALPDLCEVRQYAFDGCTSLLWVYAGENTQFVNINAAVEPNSTASFFPTNTNLTIVFPSAAVYNAVMTQTDRTFKNNNGGAATYVVNVNCYVGKETVPVVYKRLHNRPFNYVCDEATGYWNTDTAYNELPAQAAHYASTVWYGEKELTNKVRRDKVDTLLSTESEINLYCHATIAEPTFPAEPASWVYSDKVRYDISDFSAVLKALGCLQTFSDEQLDALCYEVVYVNTDGKAAQTPDAIKRDGVYSVNITLNPDYGTWIKPAVSTVTVNVNTKSFNKVLIVFLVIGILALIATVSTAVIRKRVQTKARRKQLSSQEVLEKFRSIGGETDLK